MTRSWVDFRAVKANISMEMALAQYGIMLHRVNRCHIRGRCPLPTHASKNSVQSFIVNTEKNAWACHSSSCVSARGGRLGGNVLDFVASMENCGSLASRLAWDELQPWLVGRRGSRCDRASRRSIEERGLEPSPSIHVDRHRLSPPLPSRARHQPGNCSALRNWLVPRQRLHGRSDRDPDSQRGWNSGGIRRQSFGSG